MPLLCAMPHRVVTRVTALSSGGVWWGRVLIYACILLGETSHCSYTTRDVTPTLVNFTTPSRGCSILVPNQRLLHSAYLHVQPPLCMPIYKFRCGTLTVCDDATRECRVDAG